MQSNLQYVICLQIILAQTKSNLWLASQQCLATIDLLFYSFLIYAICLFIINVIIRPCNHRTQWQYYKWPRNFPCQLDFLAKTNFIYRNKNYIKKEKFQDYYHLRIKRRNDSGFNQRWNNYIFICLSAKSCTISFHGRK